MEVVMQITNFRIEIAGFPINDYRITDRDLEFRALDPTGHRFRDQRGTWRRLTADELVLHFGFDTVVARWFLEKTAESDSEAAQQELRKAA